MLNKLKLLYKLSPILLVSITVFSIYFGYNCWQDEKAANAKVTELNNEITQLKQDIKKANQVVAENETTKIELENKSLELQERIDELLKNNQCANELVPDSVSNKLYERAFNIRQSTNTGQSIK